MKDEIEISKYKDYFHDGFLLNVSKNKDNIAFLMSSAEVDLSKIDKNLALSNNHRIRGVLHLHGIKHIHLTGEHKLEDLFNLFDFGTILDFELVDKTIELGVLWENYPPKFNTNEFTTILIKFECIWWKNIPDLFDPFW